MEVPQGVSFAVADVEPVSKERQAKRSRSSTTFAEVVAERVQGKLVTSTDPGRVLQPSLDNGFVDACLTAYNEHYHLELTPDAVWVAITTALARYIDHKAEALRPLFVEHEGQKELVVYGSGSLKTANYPALIALMTDEIEKNTKGDVRSWFECDFTTTGPTSRTVSKVVLMGAMKKYFTYEFCLRCGLPGVTLRGTKADWEEIQTRVRRMTKWGDQTLVQWAEVLLTLILPHFISAFDGPVDKDFWNRIAHKSGGGSGPSYLNGWVLAFIAFGTTGDYLLAPAQEIQRSNNFGKLDITKVPVSAVEVPVKVDDNGTIYETILYAGAIVGHSVEDRMLPSLDWALIDVTGQTPHIEPQFST
eukprot:CAMPEP_0170622032 /NCGR_PEP_ID=MMETSP0224-20130122/28912_1 /TAXON_ID=285029 /ORGANISM="Togula jolla, Strain CCCM 725" /LENGTH=360 /DNA_ID=CAMNT_0010948319 /DNA_START=58 /DNA_END=1140 /DNA_ORIENTATION=-